MRYRFSTDTLPIAERFPYWRDVICPEFYSLTPGKTPDAATFTAWNDIRDAGRFGFAQYASSERERSRSASDIARDGTEYVTLYRAEQDCQQFDFGASEIALDTGDMCAVSTSQRFKSCSRDGMAFRTLIVPAAVLAPLVAGNALRRPLHLRASSPFGMLLSASLDVAWQQIANMSEHLGEAVLVNLANLLAIAYGASEEGNVTARQCATRLRSDLVLRHIEHHLADPDLTPDHAARALGMSVRQVHAVLEPTGESFSRHLMYRRLEACRLTLEHPAAAHRSVTDIALGWGFSSLATFYRAFRAAYGAAPGDLRPATGAVKAD